MVEVLGEPDTVRNGRVEYIYFGSTIGLLDTKEKRPPSLEAA